MIFNAEDWVAAIALLCQIAWLVLVIHVGWILYKSSYEQNERLIEIEQKIELLLEENKND